MRRLTAEMATERSSWAGLAGWLILSPAINRVVARNVDADNTPSRRALERAGFLLEDDDGVHVAYAFEAPR